MMPMTAIDDIFEGIFLGGFVTGCVIRTDSTANIWDIPALIFRRD